MTLLDQSSYDAKVVGVDVDKDVAVLQLQGIPEVCGAWTVSAASLTHGTHTPRHLGKAWPCTACMWTYVCLLWCTALRCTASDAPQAGLHCASAHACACMGTSGQACDLRHWRPLCLRLHSQAELKMLRPVSVGSSTGLLVGQRVYAIGNPFGLDHTLTQVRKST